MSAIFPRYFLPFFILVCFVVNGCIHPQVKFQKAYHLDPTMDTVKQPRLAESILQSEAKMGIEKAVTGNASGLGASCPTCGH